MNKERSFWKEGRKRENRKLITFSNFPYFSYFCSPLFIVIIFSLQPTNHNPNKLYSSPSNRFTNHTTLLPHILLLT